MVGCRLNQSEIDSDGAAIPAGRDTKIVDTRQPTPTTSCMNTCAVTQRGDQDQPQTDTRLSARASQAWRHHRDGLLRADCAAARSAVLPGVQRVIGNRDKDQLGLARSPAPMAAHDFDSEPLRTRDCAGIVRAYARLCQSARRLRQCLHLLRYHHCAWRGPAAARSDACPARGQARCSAGGCQEAVLTGVHLGQLRA